MIVLFDSMVSDSYIYLFRLSLVAGLIFLDSAPFGQWFIAQPIISAPLLGFLGGVPMAGIIIGLLLQPFWANKLPVGTSCPPEAPILAMSTVIFYRLATFKEPMGIMSPYMVPVILMGIISGVLGGFLTIKIRTLNNYYSLLSDRWAKNNNSFLISWIPLCSLVMDWILYSFLFIIMGFIFMILHHWMENYQYPIHYMQFYPWLLTAISFAVIGELFQVNKRYKLLVTGIFLGCLAGYINQYHW